LPFVAVRLWRANRSVWVTALVDSGADSCLFDVGHAEDLGLDRADAVEDSAVIAGGDQVVVWTWPSEQLGIEFEDRRFPFCGRFMDFRGADGVNLLGRRDFFAPFIIQFWDAEELINIDLSPSFPKGPSQP
jgi:hypothetical protein